MSFNQQPFVGHILFLKYKVIYSLGHKYKSYPCTWIACRLPDCELLKGRVSFLVPRMVELINSI